MIENKTIIITGGAGFIGSSLIRQIFSTYKNVKIINVDNLTYAGTVSRLKDVEDNKNYIFEKVDICNRKAVEEIFNKYLPDNIIHLAAESHVDHSIDGPSIFIQTNIVGTFNLLDIALQYWNSLEKNKKSKFLFQHISTDEVFGSLEFDNSLFSETSRYDPSSPYSASKACADHLVNSWNKTYNLPTIITNCSNNFGPYQYPEKLIPLSVIKILRNEDIPVYGKGDRVRDWLYVDDHTEALLKVMKHGSTGNTYNIGGNNQYSNLSVINMICEILEEITGQKDLKRLITFVKDRPAHDKRYAIDASKIRNEIKWSPKKDFKSALYETIIWYTENRHWWENIIDKNLDSIVRKGII